MNLIDSINHTNLRTLGPRMYALVDGMQDFPPNEQVQAVAVLFSLMCEEFNTHPHRVLEAAQAMTKHVDNKYDMQVHAARRYIRNELMKDPPV